MVDQRHLSEPQKALIAPVITHGNFYYFGDVPESLTFIQRTLTAIVEFAPVGYKQLKITFFGSVAHGNGYDASDVVYDAMSEVRRKMAKGLRVTIAYTLQVSREVEVAQEVEDV